jgi:hypothetical protein
VDIIIVNDLDTVNETVNDVDDVEIVPREAV